MVKEGKNKIILLMPEGVIDECIAIIAEIGIENFIFKSVSTKEQLTDLFNELNDISYLISFGTSVIVPEFILAKKGLISVNIHASSPEFPGRDPHHYAIYEGVSEYGATLHYMTKSVDSGPIIDVELFKVTEDDTPLSLLQKANHCSWLLIRKILFWIKTNQSLPSSPLEWSTKKRTRKDFLNYCKIDTSITQEELHKRIKAFHVEGFNNISLEIHGIKFFYKPEKS